MEPGTHTRALYVLSHTDALFPPSLSPEVMPLFTAAGLDARYFEIDSPHGHLGSDVDALKWAPVLGAFLGELAGICCR